MHPIKYDLEYTWSLDLSKFKIYQLFCMKAQNTSIGFVRDRTHLYRQLRQLKVTKPFHTAQTEEPKIMREYNIIQSELQHIRVCIVELKELHLRCLRITFGSKKLLKKEIWLKNQLITQKIIDCENQIELLSRINAESEAEKQIIKNVRFILNEQLKEISKEMRIQQYKIVQTKDFHKVNDGGKFLQLDDKKQIEMGLLDQQKSTDQENIKNDKEIDQIVDSMGKLTELFKQMNEIVSEQSQILDRVDYNIEHTVVNIQRSKSEIVQAETQQEQQHVNPSSKCCIQALTTLILVFSGILASRF